MNTNNQSYKYLLLVIVVFVVHNTTTAQENQNYGSWNAIFLTKGFSKDWNARLEYHHRTTSFLKEHEQTVVRPSINYRLDSTFAFATGYSYIHNNQNANRTRPNFYEHNIWQQASLKHELGKLAIDHRLRLEERFIDAIVTRDNKQLVDGSNYRTRLRYRLTASLAVLPNPALSLLAYNELFLDFDTGLLPETVDQNWIFLGPQIGIAKGLNLTTDYHYIVLARPGSDVQRHIWDTILSYTF